ncbi:hypothetical protein [Chromobacterium sp. IIBBL 290-4]|uniref:hypothetical protein n=1 Tax=Chromobacterium sp. IIBBL 290-4 TaxID=2953890 RepID=UPI0020B7C1DF|nr:hypothetical protein [Chromobacterium sp. IIBBL 290-4]UTH74187.1 hypothetical protein NKT35_22045 [Chromobacterium sp. IIBBL 290-4]
MFEIGKSYNREEIHAVVGGNKHSYLPRKKGKVVAACLRPDLNPDAPNVILCNSCPPERAAGEQLARQGGVIPVFLKETASSWKYQGMFRVVSSETHPDICAPHAARSAWTAGQIKQVLTLEKQVQF